MVTRQAIKDERRWLVVAYRPAFTDEAGTFHRKDMLPAKHWEHPRWKELGDGKHKFVNANDTAKNVKLPLTCSVAHAKNALTYAEAVEVCQSQSATARAGYTLLPAVLGHKAFDTAYFEWDLDVHGDDPVELAFVEEITAGLTQLLGPGMTSASGQGKRWAAIAAPDLLEWFAERTTPEILADPQLKTKLETWGPNGNGRYYVWTEQYDDGQPLEEIPVLSLADLKATLPRIAAEPTTAESLASNPLYQANELGAATRLIEGEAVQIVIMSAAGTDHAELAWYDEATQLYRKADDTARMDALINLSTQELTRKMDDDGVGAEQQRKILDAIAKQSTVRNARAVATKVLSLASPVTNTEAGLVSYPHIARRLTRVETLDSNKLAPTQGGINTIIPMRDGLMDMYTGKRLEHADARELYVTTDIQPAPLNIEEWPDYLQPDNLDYQRVRALWEGWVAKVGREFLPMLMLVPEKLFVLCVGDPTMPNGDRGKTALAQVLESATLGSVILADDAKGFRDGANPPKFGAFNKAMVTRRFTIVDELAGAEDAPHNGGYYKEVSGTFQFSYEDKFEDKVKLPRKSNFAVFGNSPPLLDLGKRPELNNRLIGIDWPDYNEFLDDDELSTNYWATPLLGKYALAIFLDETRRLLNDYAADGRKLRTYRKPENRPPEVKASTERTKLAIAERWAAYVASKRSSKKGGK